MKKSTIANTKYIPPTNAVIGDKFSLIVAMSDWRARDDNSLEAIDGRSDIRLSLFGWELLNSFGTGFSVVTFEGMVTIMSKHGRAW